MTQSKRVLVIGLGRFGIALARELWDNGAELILVDSDERSIDSLKDFSHAAFVADGTDIQALDSAGVRDIDAAVVGIGKSFEAAVLTVAALAKWGVPEIVARATTPERAEVLRSVGATRVHEVEAEMGRRAALLITTPVAADLLDLASQFRVIPWTAQGSLIGKKLSQCGIRQRYAINVLGIRPRSTEPDTAGKLHQAHPEYVINHGDCLLLVGEEENVTRFVSETG